MMTLKQANYKSKPVLAAFLLVLSLLPLALSGGSMPANWWTHTNARSIGSWEEYVDVLSSEGSTKHVFVDFYMKNCPYCYYCQEDFNRIVSDMQNWFGADKVLFLKVDGQVVTKISSHYGV